MRSGLASSSALAFFAATRMLNLAFDAMLIVAALAGPPGSALACVCTSRALP